MIARYYAKLLAALLIVAGPVWADTPPTGRWEPITEMWDEFNGAQLDPKKWNNQQNPSYPGRKPGLVMPYNAKLENGELNLYTRSETAPRAPPGYTFTTANISNKNLVKFGYFEVRAKVAKSRVNCSFWLYRWTENGSSEIDIAEVAGMAQGHESSLHTNAHVYYGPAAQESDQTRRSDPQVWKTTTPIADDYHVFGLEWDEKELKWYYDGKLVRIKANTDWYDPMTIILATEIHENWMGLPAANELPAIFKVDYFRAWRKVAVQERTAQPVSTK